MHCSSFINAGQYIILFYEQILMPDSHITANVRASHAKTMLTGST